MADGVLSFGVEKLWELLSRESERLQGVDKQLDELKCQLRMLQSLLKDADAKKYESERVRNFLEDVKDIVCDAEDIIESFLLNELTGKEKGITKRVKRLACFLVNRRNFVSAIEGITKNISEVIGRMQSFGIQQIIDGVRSPSLQERQRVQRESRQIFPNNSESDLVGLEQSVEELVGHLVENDNIQVVSISGMGGIGKTTLARQVYHHDSVQRHFDGFAWICLSQQFTRNDVWQRILQDLRPQDENILQMNEYTLQNKLFQLLETGRYLIFLDDVWKNEDWDRIKVVFPAKKGWKMLLTSRDNGVGLHANRTCFSFRLRTLTAEESWILCLKVILRNREETEFRVDEEMEALGKGMVTYCDGLPLAVKVLGGLLAKKHTVFEWKRVSDTIAPRIVGKSGSDPNSVFRILSLSYEDLPMHLKHCFLYLAVYPENFNITADILFQLWAAEGIITSFSNGPTFQECGEDYLAELVRKNMVVAEKSYSTSRIKYCRLHDMMREVCLSKAKEENFLQIVKVPTSTSTINAQPPSTARRLVIHSSNDLHLLRHQNNQKVRSLLVFGGEETSWIQSAPGFRSLPLLRVLDLSWVKFEGGKLPSSIGKLIHLRFLSLRHARVSHLPSSLRNLKQLLLLNLGVHPDEILRVPNVLKEMLELRFLFLPLSMCPGTKLELGDLVNLEILCFFSTMHSSVTDLVGMTKLRFLDLVFHGGCTSETLSSSLRVLEDLETFSLYVSPELHVADDWGEFVLDLIHLKDLSLFIHMPRFPEPYRFPPHLAHINLSYCSMQKDPMPILENLLQLKSVELAYDAFAGKRIVCSKGGFPQLYVLKLCALQELGEWIVEEESMPCLRTLHIIECKKLKELPEGLKYITSLKELKIKRMKREWKEKLVTGGEDYYKVQHIPSVQFMDCDD